MKSIAIALIVIGGLYLLNSLTSTDNTGETLDGICSFNKIERNPPNFAKTELKIFNDEELVWPLELECKPDSFGYSSSQAESLFPDKVYPSCVKSSYMQSKLHFDKEKNVLSMSCQGKYLLGPKNEVFGRTEFYEDLKEYHSEVKLKTEEFAMGTCDKDTLGFFEHVEYKNHINKEALERAKASLIGKPVNIAMVVLDSVSRRSFYRKLPKTLEYLKQSPTRFHDFYIHNVMGEYSADSFMPTFLGDVPFERLSDENLDTAPFSGQYIWDYMYQKGFVTYVATDDCGNDLAAFIGRQAKIDHKIASFYCAAEKYYNFENNAKMQRCIGMKNAHTYMLDYLLEFSENYAEVSRFSYIHLNTAHEGSGTVISTLDEDLVDFLKRFQSFSEDSVIFLMGDHGMRYGTWFTQVDGSHEHRLPLLMISTSKSWQESHPDSEAYLNYNTKRLVSKFDLNVALKYLVDDSMFIQEPLAFVCETSTRYRSYNIFGELIPNNRSCTDSGIPLFWCSCMPFKERSDLVGSEKIKKITEEIIYSINSKSYSGTLSSSTICQRLTLNKITSIKTQKTTNEQYFKIQFNTNQSKKVLFEALVLISDIKLRRRLNDGFGSFPYYYSDRQYIKIMYIKRLDAYAGLCQDISLIKQIDPMLCVCKSFEELRELEPKVIDDMYSIREVIIANGTCENTCYAKGMSCDEFALDLFKDCENISEKVCKRCDKGEKKYNFYRNGVCYIGKEPSFSCTEKYEDGLCYCKVVKHR